MRYTLYANNSFEVDFIWDEDFAEEMAYINSTTQVPEPQRANGLDFLKQRQLERKTRHLYDTLALALLRNAPTSGSPWQQLVLTLTQPPLHYEAHTERTPAPRAPVQRQALLLLGEHEAVEALVELTEKGDHLGWERAQVVVQPTGAYRFSFEWAGAPAYKLPRHYHRDGQATPPESPA
ncbi:hypothetical protein QMK33_06030 [Hymenobacter sp. H14-R3]|uniref:hypothetical protein n=1 Tax=Hymenobacter sp. H14-R3 TaxID=3046308 RepID=UPI0024B8BC40|nr:hypothetical protein [Hymenobacter sp. H14-R3]MDJ0364705.1 hypothetical protein [Hymenobacter sp. H14-R3]